MDERRIEIDQRIYDFFDGFQGGTYLANFQNALTEFKKVKNTFDAKSFMTKHDFGIMDMFLWLREHDFQSGDVYLDGEPNSTVILFYTDKDIAFKLQGDTLSILTE